MEFQTTTEPDDPIIVHCVSCGREIDMWSGDYYQIEKEDEVHYVCADCWEEGFNEI